MNTNGKNKNENTPADRDNTGAAATASRITGLTEIEAKNRVKSGLSNRVEDTGIRSTREIIKSNVVTYFNFVFLVIAILLIACGSVRNLTFLPVIIANTLIGIIQELRAKNTLERMRLISAPRTNVVRDGEVKTISSDGLVLDDIVMLTSGDQICADAEVVEGEIGTDESLLTGETNEIRKIRGDKLMSGSFVVSGTCYARLTAVGSNSYISKLSAQAKTMEMDEQSEMVRGINLMAKGIGILVIPIGIALIVQACVMEGETIKTGVSSMAAAALGMIPEGIYLLTTIALALGTVRLFQRKVLLHDMKSIEALARVDVLCVDKTGTITEPKMKVSEVLYIEKDASEGYKIASSDALTSERREYIEQLLYDYINLSADTNATMRSLKGYAVKGSRAVTRKVREQMAFSSAYKYSLTELNDGVYVLGAPEFIMRDDFSSVADLVKPYTSKGYRVLFFGRYEGEFTRDKITDKVEPLACITLSNPVRANAAKTFKYFREQGVRIKVISGDDPETVAEAARQANISGSSLYVDASTFKTNADLLRAAHKYTVFGRVTPDQKKKLIRSFKDAGHTVAMTGDGVNDILAMKEADCSVAMRSGSEAAQHAAQVVLLDSDFAHMPDVVLEGRRVVNNIERSATLFLVKNIFSLLLAVMSMILTFTYPLQPAQVSLFSTFTITVPGFLLALENTGRRIEGKFLKNVLMRAIPGALADVITVMIFTCCGEAFGFSSSEIATSATILLSLIGFMIVINNSQPMTHYRIAVLAASIAGWVLALVFFKWWYLITPLSFYCAVLMAVFALAACTLFYLFGLMGRFIEKKLGK